MSPARSYSEPCSASLAGWSLGAQFLAGYVVEKSLSVDNLFVFVIIMSTFAVPAEHQPRALAVGIALALVLRAIFIALGAALLAAFSFMFLIFGFALIVTAVQLFRHRDQDPSVTDNALVALARRRLPLTQGYDGGRIVTRVNGRRMLTPLFIVLLAIGTTDFLFALDSIPAVYGVTRHPYIVLAANVFALLGLRALFFVVSGLLDRLVYLSTGLSVILTFIGVKLVLHFAHLQHHPVPEISTGGVARGDRGRARGHDARKPRARPPPAAAARACGIAARAPKRRAVHGYTLDPMVRHRPAGDPDRDARKESDPDDGSPSPMGTRRRAGRDGDRGGGAARRTAGPRARGAATRLDPWTVDYALVGVMAFLETGAGIGLVAPGELAVIVGGVAANQGEVELAPLIALVWVCAVAGDTRPTSSAGGWPRVPARARPPDQAHSGPARAGRAVLRQARRQDDPVRTVHRLGTGARAFVAGASRMPARRFFPATIAAAGLWALACSLLGYVFWNSLDHAVELARQGTFAIAAAAAVAAAGAYALKRRRRRIAASERH